MIWRYRKILFLKIMISCCFKVVKIWTLLCILQLLRMRKHLNGFIKYKNTASTWWLVLKILRWLLIQIFYPEKLKHSLFNNGIFKAVYLVSVLVFSVWNCAFKLLFVLVEILEFVWAVLLKIWNIRLITSLSPYCVLDTVVDTVCETDITLAPSNLWWKRRRRQWMRAPSEQIQIMPGRDKC